MTEIEYQEFVRRCPYDAMGDYSMFRKQQTENKQRALWMILLMKSVWIRCFMRWISQAIWQT